MKGNVARHVERLTTWKGAAELAAGAAKNSLLPATTGAVVLLTWK